MKTLAAIAVCFALSAAYAPFATSGEQQTASSASTQPVPTAGDELHFVNVLTYHGEIVAVDPAKRLITLKGPNGELLILEAEREQDIAGRKVGERVLVRYFEGGQIEKTEAGEAVSVHSLKNGMLGARVGGSSGKQAALAGSVERVDAANQEITLRGPDGSLETIMVSNPEKLSKFTVGDRVVIVRPQALALSLEKEG